MPIRAERERDDSEALQIVASCQAVLHNRVMEARRSMSDTTDCVVGLDAGTTVVEPEQTEDAESKPAAGDGIETGSNKDEL